MNFKIILGNRETVQYRKWAPEHNTPKRKGWLNRTTNYPRPQMNPLLVCLVLETFINLTHPDWLLRGSWMRILSMVNEMRKKKVQFTNEGVKDAQDLKTYNMITLIITFLGLRVTCSETDYWTLFCFLSQLSAVSTVFDKQQSLL